ncbi:MAG: alpha/beta hydrolase fold protein [Actinomycetia bacterium]|nr:alpha/beta hydrolase fold protein [Actinomycetes bacterium]
MAMPCVGAERQAGTDVGEVRATRVASGRDVGYYEFGDPSGFPVIALHGTPASGAGFLFAHESARAHGLRLLAPDRPGVGRSDLVKRRPVRAYASDLAEFADALGIDRFAVLGYSGGGPFACAAAYGLPHRVQSVAVVAGAGQIGVWATPRESDVMDWFFMRAARYSPFVASGLLWMVAEVAKRVPQIPSLSIARELGEADRDAFASPVNREAAVRMFTDAFVRGSRGAVDDYAAIAEPWGFDVEDIRVPIYVFQGDADTIVPLAHAEALTERVPDAKLVVWPGAGHFGVITHIDEVFTSLFD